MRLTLALALAALLFAPVAGAQAPRRPLPPVLRPSIPTRADSIAMRRGIEAGNLAYLDAFKRGDLRALTEVYDADAVQMRPGGMVIRGRGAIAANLAPLLQRIRFINGSITSSSLWRVDDLVYDIGHYTFVFQPAGKDTLVEKSRYLNIWKRQADGSWKIFRDLPIPRDTPATP